MSNNLNSLLRRVEKSDKALASELRVQIEELSKRREFGLNFEKHRPETVELHGRALRKGDKVRFIPPRGSQDAVRRDTWVVQDITGGDSPTASLILHDGDEAAERALDDLVVVADFRDPIYPGLSSTGRVERGGDKPFHAVINAENYHALEAMLFTYQGQVDAIYIDPPYNTGAKDWKYNNDYVDTEDSFRHSKWLSFMERRLNMARKLLNPVGSVLIVTIDEKEYLRLGLLLEQIFPGSKIQMVSSVINPAGVARGSEFARVDEYIFVVLIGSMSVGAGAFDMLFTTPGEVADPDAAEESTTVSWDSLLRRGTGAARTDRPKMFYPVWVDPVAERIHSVGESLPLGASRDSVTAPESGLVPCWPLRSDGSEGRWKIAAATLREQLAAGTARLGGYNAKRDQWAINYLYRAERERIERGETEVVGRDAQGALVLRRTSVTQRTLPKNVWNVSSHNAALFGTGMLRNLIPGRKFPFPKSLYAVEDVLRFFVKNKPEALIIDFFGGSGTTTHAVARLNKQDGGNRRSVIVTNNEVSADEQKALRADGHRPGDPEWEALGICSYITKPRIEAAFSGKAHDGSPVKGEYKFVDPFPMADGFDENVEFFDLTYQDPLLVSMDLAFSAVAPLLWLRAGSMGRRIDTPNHTFDVADGYAVLFSVDAAAAFLAAIKSADQLKMVFIVTDDERQFQMIAKGLPDGVEPVRLYESYLRTFEINTGKE